MATKTGAKITIEKEENMRRIVTAFLAVMLLLAMVRPASADEGRRHFGPFAGGSPDSGTCGNDWAHDTFKRFFTVTANPDGSLDLREDFKEGKFLTVAGRSPGGCQAALPHGSEVAAGIKGNFHGFLGGPVTGGTFNPNATCNDPCTGSSFVLAFFGVSADNWNVNTFKFTYHAEGEHLAFRNWQNASADQGGNRGDIASE